MTLAPRVLALAAVAALCASCGSPPKVVVDTLRVVSWSPSRGARCIAVEPGEFAGTATFSDDLQEDSVTADSFFLRSSSGRVEAATSYDRFTRTARVVPLGALDHHAAYSLVATQDLLGKNQGRLVAELVSDFETVAAVGCYHAE